MQQNRLVFFLIVIAAIMAIAGFLLISFLTRGVETPVEAPQEPTAPAGGDGAAPVGLPVQVDGTTVYLNTVLERSVRLRDQAQPANPTPAEPEPTPQPTVAVVPPTETPQPAQPAPGTQSIIFIDYVVQPDDTLYRIAEKEATSIELMAVHGISSRDLTPGATISLPVANSAQCGGGARTYVVRPGDTVFNIAKRFNTTTEAIAAANNLGADFRIDVAQVLCIP